MSDSDDGYFSDDDYYDDLDEFNPAVWDTIISIHQHHTMVADLSPE